jgi:glycosyltransferase involved in cell wall biosynthesis
MSGSPASALRHAAVRAALPLLRGAARAATAAWPDHSRLMLMTGGGGWVLSEEARAIAGVAGSLGIRVAEPYWMRLTQRQSVFYACQFSLLAGPWIEHTHRLGVAYFHGLPGTGVEEFDHVYAQFRRRQPRLDRVQVSHSQMRDVVLETGIDPAKVHQIPIGVQAGMFPVQTPASRAAARRRLGIPESAFVVGSFQKDGVGWGDGNEPKLVKGPDVLLRAVEALHARVPELFVLLSGPARGYVRQGLERLGVPCHHVYLPDYAGVAELYQALDLYLVGSRQEGGPKAVLESMCSGVPLVTTRVGQAMDLVRHGENGWMVEPGDAEGLAHWAHHVAQGRGGMDGVLRSARRTAELHDYAAQAPLWARLLDGFVAASR